ncbi:hypothetical protein CAPTEDRAFT_226021 [Capitella teleta]|uniref:Uncharacterized protein n=1 Tax=Capitella teleta TaxID=283909 RepID=R7TJM1_CAPTE|nr:hypothetical protein CAPTEDRAFT_226021 [Capitella teleta]|eukprot:ELT93697.1 hypothetical protein CAPTEDRAFT_226021 [Capitella teleta]
MASLVQNIPECASFLPLNSANVTAQPAGHLIRANVELWQGVVLAVCFGAFALLVSLIHRVVRTYIYYDAHLLDTYFDAGGDTNFALIVSLIVAKTTWTTSYTWASSDVFRYGIVGGFWYAAGMVVHLFLFAIVACEIRIKAPGAKTFLQVIYKRHGTAAHVICMIMALMVSLVISGVAMVEGTRIISVLTEGLSTELTSVILAIAVGLFTVVGGLGGAIYVSFFATAIIMIVALVFFADAFFDPLSRKEQLYGSWEKFWEVAQCGHVDLQNEGGSIVTFLSRDGMLQGIIVILSGFTSVFVNQSYWQVAVAAKPGTAVWGFLAGGIIWFILPVACSFFFGLAYWKIVLDNDSAAPLSENDLSFGYMPAYVTQKLWDKAGDFMMFMLTLAASVMAACSEVLAISSIIMYDIYQTYVSPFKASEITENKDVAVRTRRAVQNEEYLEYDRRCVILKHFVVILVTCLLIPITIVLMKLDVDMPWLFQFLSVVAGSFVLPVSLAISWHRITTSGILVGGIGGCIAGIVSWLAYAATMDGSLDKFLVNSGQREVMLTAAAVSLSAGGLLCILVSLSCGGCDNSLLEEEEWEKTRMIDNPILPWAVKYAPDIHELNRNKGTPHFYTVRRSYKWAEIAAYIIGVFLAVSFILVWPACMLLADIFSKSVFYNWFLVIFVWLCVSTGFVVIIPLLAEIVQVCQQAYYNRAWKRAEKHQRLDEDSSHSVRPGPMQTLDAHSLKTESDFTLGRDTMKSEKERWKTFIALE